jgi:hypothetical protein
VQSSLELQLLKSYGPLLTIKQLATVLHRSPAGLSYTLSHGGELADKLNRVKIKIGRRSYFSASGLAEVLS